MFKPAYRVRGTSVGITRGGRQRPVEQKIATWRRTLYRKPRRARISAPCRYTPSYSTRGPPWRWSLSGMSLTSSAQRWSSRRLAGRFDSSSFLISCLLFSFYCFLSLVLSEVHFCSVLACPSSFETFTDFLAFFLSLYTNSQWILLCSSTFWCWSYST